ncbi:heparinase II/III family protein [Stieleria sp. TO1_6]|uniref:heparinase II/III family protein n=1 Tax=Stieleria tagensis TaxID=2956795 RepID=UPI00209A6669|nr:heparinase II/III family protein [Stieleria tagensis]MCO8123453.1 heparinase II/III family protein [Stieleria tagensis]
MGDSNRLRLSRSVALIRYHRPGQFVWRSYRVFQRQLRRRMPERLVFVPRRTIASWKLGADVVCRQIAERRRFLWPERSSDAAKIAEGRFTFLNQTLDLNVDSGDGGQRLDWNPDAPRLWRFHLHCQEDLLELAETKGADAAYQLIASWLAEPRNQFPTRDADAWHPFCLSRRLPVWLSLASVAEPPLEIAGVFWASVADQVSWLRRNCEWDLGGNHLLENLTALYLADSFLEFHAYTGPRGSIDLSQTGMPKSNSIERTERLLLEQLDEQILETGEHFERTPTYHALMLVCVLQCIEAADLNGSGQRDRLIRAASRMNLFAKYLRQANGRFPLLSDSVQDETPDLDKLLAWADTAWDPSITNTPTLDYWTCLSGDGDRLLFDTGPLACDHLPAHGHADLLQITATIGGREAIVDTGNFEYSPTPMRQRCRSTAAHNVLQLGDQEQCDLWSSFRMGRRGHPVWRQTGHAEDYSWCAAAHNAYGCLVGRVVISHRRCWNVIDWFRKAPEPVIPTSRLHWHPDWKLEMTEVDNVVLVTHSEQPKMPALVQCIGMGNQAILDSSVFCPNFGERFANQVLVNRSGPATDGWLGFRVSRHPIETPVPLTFDLFPKHLEFVLDKRDRIKLSLKDGFVMQ